MTTHQKKPKLLNITLWVAQVMLAITFIWAAAMKLFLPADELAAMWPWTAAHKVLVKVTGVVDLLAGVGLIFPAMLRIQPRLTVYAAYGTIVLMIAASAFHLMRGEGSQIGFNVFVAFVAIFIAWGRGR